MTFTISITRTAQRALGGVAKRDRERIYARLDQLAADPYATANVKKLHAELVITVVDVGHRREVYR